MGNLQLFLEVHRGTGGLFAVAQGRVENDDALGIKQLGLCVGSVYLGSHWVVRSNEALGCWRSPERLGVKSPAGPQGRISLSSHRASSAAPTARAKLSVPLFNIWKVIATFTTNPIAKEPI